MRSRMPLAVSLASVLSVSFAGARAPAASWGPRAADPTGAIARAAAAATEGLTWYGMDGHLHSDHSHDAGVFHQGTKAPENHDTTVQEQLEQAARMGEDFGTITDHRTFDQHYDPGFRSDTLTLIPGEEWGGYPHATVWGLSEVLEQGPPEPSAEGNADGVCGVARATLEAHAQDAVYGIAHPEDDRTSGHACITERNLSDVPLDHLEVWRAPHDGFWFRNLQAGNRFPPSNGSDNHFKQLWGTDGGPGAMSVFVLARARTQAALVEAVKAGRTFATTSDVNPRLTTFLDADSDGTFDAITGGFAVPPDGAETVRVAFRVEGGAGYWIQWADETGTIVAQAMVVTPDQTIAHDLPATAKLYVGMLSVEPAARVTGNVVHDYLAYEDTRRVLSSPVYLSAPTPIENGTQSAVTGAPVALSDATFAGFADVARSGDHVAAVWQQRVGDHYQITLAESFDGGATWSAPRVISPDHLDSRAPSVAVDGSHIIVVYEAQDVGVARLGLWRSDGRLPYFLPRWGVGQLVRPSVVAAEGVDHIAWMSMEDGYKIRYARWDGEVLSDPVIVFSGKSYDGPAETYSVPPRKLRHVVAAVHPVIAADGDSIAVAWEDNREDPTPLRNGSPDDWGIWLTTSTDGGATWSPDHRVSPRFDRKGPDPTKAENVEGTPARHADLLWGSDGALYLAYQHTCVSPNLETGLCPNSNANVYVARSDDDGATFGARALVSTPTGEFNYKPKLAETAGGIEVVWQASQGRRWNLRRSMSTDAGATWAPQGDFTTGTGYAGWPALAPGVVVWTGEEHGTYGVFAAPL